MKEALFIKSGIAFIILVPTMLIISGASEFRSRNRDGEISVRLDRLEGLWLDSSPLADLRKFLLAQPERYREELVRALPYAQAKALHNHLTRLPPSARHDQELIRLRAMVENFVKALDKQRAEGIIEQLPEVKEDKEA